RSYGVASYEIHLKQCKEMWEAKQKSLPLVERKPVPKEPEVQEVQGVSEHKQLEVQNQAAMESFNNEALEACAHCGRTFLPER
ncbi:unnamed protein product, partial [Discosporangium mesarthrocarpum]